MSNLKFRISLLIMFGVTTTHLHANSELPFYDDFSNDYANWQTFSVSGSDQWHISGDDGIDGGKCARFYITSNPADSNDDWLLTKVLNTEGITHLAAEFKFMYHGDGPKPEFYYSSSFDGNISSTEWTEVDNSFWKNDWAWNDARIEIENPGATFVLAIRYQNEGMSSQYILIDNFSIEEYVPVINQLVGTTDNFEFYTSITDHAAYYLQIKDALEENYKKYCGHWNIPGLDDFMDNESKTKVFLMEKEHIPIFIDEAPDWKAGFFHKGFGSIYLTPLNTDEKISYYTDLQGLAIHTFAGYAHKHRLFRDRYGWDYEPFYFTEAFGLYEMGYRPIRDSIISFLSDHPEELTHEHLENFNRIHNTSEKDIAVSYVEGQILLTLGYRSCEAHYGSYLPIWNNYLTYFYDTSDDVQIKKYDESENFDIYCSSRDTIFIDSMKIWLEKTHQYYVDSFQMEINVRYPLIILYDEQTGMDLTGYDNFNGGAGSLNISPHNFWGGFYNGYDWLLGHEFGHVFNSLMYCDFPFGFYHEGMANFSGYKIAGGEHLDDLWKIEYVFNYYENKYSREPSLEEFITNPDVEDPDFYGIDCYFFGFEFIRFLKMNEGYLKIKEFFNNGLDFGVFAMSYEEIESGYIEYLKYLGTLLDHNEPVLTVNKELNIEKGGSGIIGTNYLSAEDEDVSDDQLFFKIRTMPVNGYIEKITNPGIPIAKFTQQDLKLKQVRYVNESADADSDSIIFTLTDETFFIENLRFNIALTQPTSLSDLHNVPESGFSIFPNPVTSKATVTFSTKTSGYVNLEVYNLKGQQLHTLLDKKLLPGTYLYELDRSHFSPGLYVVYLSTPLSTSMIKMIVAE